LIKIYGFRKKFLKASDPGGLHYSATNLSITLHNLQFKRSYYTIMSSKITRLLQFKRLHDYYSSKDYTIIIVKKITRLL